MVLLADGLQRAGHSVLVAMLYPGGPLEVGLQRTGVPILSLEKRGRYDFAGVAVRLARAIRREEEAAPHPRTPRDRHTLVAMGRLVPQKGFDLLLRAFAQCAATYSDWTLRLLGEGAEEKNLRALASELGIGDQVEFAGLVRNAHVVLHRADLFVLSSRFEGMPNALLEAMACGLPVVSFDCPSGPRDVIRHGVDGLLVPPENVEDLATALDQLMSSESERKRLGSSARAVVERFSLERVLRMWDEALTAAIAGSS